MIDRVGQQLGNYRLLRLLGQGGFADVYLAEHVHLETQAAVKILHTKLAKDDVEAFRIEARTIARLEHPNIVRVLEFGIDGGTPFLVMSHAPNGSLRERHPRGKPLPIPTIISYVKQIADALQYAHDEKLIHRDIKPENMLVGRRNEVLLSDFGIALIAQSTSSQSKQEVIGTVTYMAPEQLQGKPRPASDQYALGVVVYEWLCGDSPFHGSFTEIASQHLFVPPPPLREKLPAIAPTIEQVVMIALVKDPQQRFKSVQAFATALEQACLSTRQVPSVFSSQSLQPVLAETPPTHYAWPPVTSPSSNQPLQPGTVDSLAINPPLAKSSISRRAVVTGLTGLAIAGGASSITWLVLSQHLQASPNASSTNHTLNTTSTPTPTPSPTPTSPLGTTLFTYSGHNAGMRALAWSPDGKRVATASDDYTAQVWDATTGRNAIIYHGHSSYVEGVAWSPNKPLIVSGGADGTAQIWDATTGSHIYTYQGHTYTYQGSAYQNHAWVNRVGWSPDGKFIVSCDQTSDSSRIATVQIWEATTGKTLITYRGHTNGVYAVAWSPDGSRIASAGYDGTLQIWERTSGNIITTYHGRAFLFGLSWSPDGKYVAVGNSDNAVLIVNAVLGNVVTTYNGHSNWVKDVAWSPNGKHIASGSDDGWVILWDTANGANIYAYNGHSGHINAVEWSPNGKLIASGGDTVQVWEAS